jgi:hypothetical protein
MTAKTKKGAAKKSAPEWPVEMLQLGDIKMDGKTQARAGMDEEAVDTYASRMADGDKFPAPVIYRENGKTNWLSDGFHRIAAARKLKWKEMACEVRQGGRRQALLNAIDANKRHGVRPNRADTQNAIELMLLDEELVTWADRRIAKHVGCDHKTVTSRREHLESTGEIPQLDRFLGLDDKWRPREQTSRKSYAGKQDAPTDRNGALPSLPEVTDEEKVRLLHDNGVPADQIALDTDVSPEKVAEILAGADAESPAGGEEKEESLAEVFAKNGKGRKKKAEPVMPDLFDRAGAKLPDRLRDVFADPYLQKAKQKLQLWYDILRPSQAPDTFKKENAQAVVELLATGGRTALTDGLRKRINCLPYLRLADIMTALEEAEDAFGRALHAINNGLAEYICPRCKGTGGKDTVACTGCRNFCGHVPHARYTELVEGRA